MRAPVVAALLVACTGDPPPTTDSPVACGEAGIALGTGSSAFEELTEGQVLAMVQGPQGGYHVPLALRGCGVGATGQIHLVGTLLSGEHVVDVTLVHPWLPEDACCGAALDLLGYLFVYGSGFSPPDLAGETLDVTAEVVDPGGAVYTDQVRVVLGPP